MKSRSRRSDKALRLARAEAAMRLKRGFGTQRGLAKNRKPPLRAPNGMPSLHTDGALPARKARRQAGHKRSKNP